MTPNSRAHYRGEYRKKIRPILGSIIVSLSAFLLQHALAQSWPSVPARDNRGTILIRMHWVDAETGPQHSTGTGFVITPEGHVLTVAHIIPEADVVLAIGETEPWPPASPRQEFPLEVVHIDRTADVAILLPTKDAVLTSVPVSWGWAPHEGAAINVRGFPLGGPLEGSPGVVTRVDASLAFTNVLLQMGHSGSPVYDSHGNVACIARGGIPVADIRNSKVMGLGFCSPLGELRPSLPEKIVRATENHPAATAASQPKGKIRISFSVDQTKETPFALQTALSDLQRPATTESYTIGKKPAEPGYRIVSYEYREHSAAKVSNRKVDLAPDGSSIEMTYQLTSGPGYDRWRGWLAATLVTIQTPERAPKE